mmetsp:Transcript_28541/g.71859  ORF Transcript_28541/g.71859 Transcript_28541/m.71859 type:complete len:201 (+) Transcript_28541:205-807(+)
MPTSTTSRLMPWSSRSALPGIPKAFSLDPVAAPSTIWGVSSKLSRRRGSRMMLVMGFMIRASISSCLRPNSPKKCRPTTASVCLLARRDSATLACFLSSVAACRARKLVSHVLLRSEAHDNICISSTLDSGTISVSSLMCEFQMRRPLMMARTLAVMETRSLIGLPASPHLFSHVTSWTSSSPVSRVQPRRSSLPSLSSR